MGLALPISFRRNLPRSVSREVEAAVHGRGDVTVLVMDNFDPKTGVPTSRVDRTVTIKNQVYQASVYGRRLRMTSKRNVPLHGIALGTTMALHESPVRVLDPSEVPAASANPGKRDERCAVCGKPADLTVVADVGGSLVYFDSDDHLYAYIRTLIEQEEFSDLDR